MDHYQKTTMGIQALRERNLNLSARQRRLLVLIGTDDLNALNPLLKQKIATPELLEQLESLGLIQQNSVEKYTEENTPLKQSEDKTIFSNFKTYPKSEILRQDSTQNAISEDIQASPSTLSQATLPTKLISVPIADESNKSQRKELKLLENPTTPIPILKLENIIEPKIEFESLDFKDVQHLMIQLLRQHCGLMASQLIQKISDSHTAQHLKRCQIQWLTSLNESKIDPQYLNHCLHQINQSLKKIIAS